MDSDPLAANGDRVFQLISTDLISDKKFACPRELEVRTDLKAAFQK
jgi:hypothetical protein